MNRTLLLDMDGTLIDTESLWFEAEQHALARFGGVLPERARLELIGLDTPTLLRRLASDYGADATPEMLAEALQDTLHDALPQARAYPGAEALVASAAAAGWRLAVVSNSPQPVIEVALRNHAWAAAIALRVSGDDVPRPKPHPDPYTRALELLGAEAQGAVAIEDSPTGVRAALAAGVHTLAVLHDAELRAPLAALTPNLVGSLEEARRVLALV